MTLLIRFVVSRTSGFKFGAGVGVGGVADKFPELSGAFNSVRGKGEGSGGSLGKKIV